MNLPIKESLPELNSHAFGRDETKKHAQ